MINDNKNDKEILIFESKSYQLITIKIREDQHKEIQRIKEITDKDRNDIIEELLDFALKRVEFKQ